MSCAILPPVYNASIWHIFYWQWRCFKIESAELQILHKRLQQQWRQWLIPQDQQRLWPHVTIQNKTDPAISNQLMNNLKADFKPFSTTALGFNLWEYNNGPLIFKSAFCFK